MCHVACGRTALGYISSRGEKGRTAQMGERLLNTRALVRFGSGQAPGTERTRGRGVRTERRGLLNTERTKEIVGRYINGRCVVEACWGESYSSPRNAS